MELSGTEVQRPIGGAEIGTQPTHAVLPFHATPPRIRAAYQGCSGKHSPQSEDEKSGGDKDERGDKGG